MIKIGVVNIDVSHPKAFADYLLKGNRAKYVAVYNDGFRGRDEVEGFYKNYNLDKICTSIEELAEYVDIGFIQGCNWDKHLEYAKPFFDRKKPVFIDKPMVGNLKDCEKLLQLAKAGNVILGCSSVRYCYEVQDFNKIDKEEKGEIINTYVTVGMDEFNYAIHAVEALGGLMGSRAESVKHVGTGTAEDQKCETYFIKFKNGKTAIYNSVIDAFMLFNFVVLTTKKSYTFTADNTKLYGTMLDKICNHLETEKSDLASIEDIVESIKIMLAGKASKENNGIEIKLSDLDKYNVFFDGYEFEKKYAAAAKKMYL